MLARGLLPVLPVFLVCIPSVFGQLPKRVEKCLPYPTLAQEIREMQPTDPVQPRVRVHVIRVEFDLEDGIPANVQEKISKELRSHTFERDADIAYLNDLANEIAEVGVRGAFRNSGYFTATAAANLRAVGSEGADISVTVAVSATPGPQYRVGNIRIESADSTSLKFSRVRHRHRLGRVPHPRVSHPEVVDDFAREIIFSNAVCIPRPDISEHVAHSDTRLVWRNLFCRTGEDRTEHRKKEHIGG
jgi:hypothetical protein